jgi:diadenosine tetraphosphate (Ap4A) HIT family hydrolase
MAERPNSGADLLDPYPQSCPFCAISAAYPHHNLSQTHHHSSSSKPLSQPLYQYVPSMPDASLVEPNCHLILNTPQVLAFLDIMPLSPGHVLVITRNHHVKLGDVPGDEARELGFWLPLVSKAVVKAVGADDWNVVQNNGTLSVPIDLSQSHNTSPISSSFAY